MNRYVRPLSNIIQLEGTCNGTSGYLCGTFQSNCAVLLRYPNGSSKVTERYFEGTVMVFQRYYDGSTFTVTVTFVDVFWRVLYIHAVVCEGHPPGADPS